MNRRKLLAMCAGSIMLGAFFGVVVVPRPLQAQEETTTDTGTKTKEQVDTLNQAVKDKQARVKELDNMIANYQTQIEKREGAQTTLANQVALLEDQVTKKQLDIERAKTETEAIQLEISSLESQIGDQGKRIDLQKEYVAELVRQIHQADDVSPLEVLLTKKSLSAFFDRLEEVKRVEGDLTDALEKVKSIKLELEGEKKQEAERKTALEEQKKVMQREQLALEAERNFKSSLADQTKSEEGEFQRILYELQAQQQSTSDDISTLETKLKDKLDNIDASLARGDVLLNWPVDPSRGITATFHDPTYPFKNLFPHPGTDVRAYVGTDVHSAAGGYVAWNKQGRMYGNYTMVVHPGNIATVYAHLSKFMAKPDTYVERGDIIGKSGGRPGDPGAGLSTGPHLHFEVRLNGIPVDPENYLPSAPHDND